MAKQFGYTASILKDSNRLTASSQADWSSLREGSFVIFDDDDNFYKVIGKEKYFYIKEFEVVTPEQIVVMDNIGVKLNLNDNITLTFKEYELSSFKIINGGSSFSKGDLISINDESVKTNSVDGVDLFAELKVEKVDDNGSILDLSIKSKGNFLSKPSNVYTVDGLELELEYSLLDKRSIETRSISNIAFNNSGTIITLNHHLPPKVKNGKLSVEKWELILNVNYPGETKINSTYKVVTDFSPLLNIPLMKKGINQQEAIFNEAVIKIEDYLRKLSVK